MMMKIIEMDNRIAKLEAPRAHSIVEGSSHSLRAPLEVELARHPPYRMMF